MPWASTVSVSRRRHPGWSAVCLQVCVFSPNPAKTFMNFDTVRTLQCRRQPHPRHTHAHMRCLGRFTAHLRRVNPQVGDSWIAIFINMSCLYWWETAHRIADANYGAAHRFHGLRLLGVPPP